MNTTKLGDITLDSIGMENVGEILKRDDGVIVASIKITSEMWNGYIDSEGYRFGGSVVDPEGYLTETVLQPWNDEVPDLYSGDPHDTYFDKIKESCGPELEDLIWGINDSDEGGYMIAILDKTIQFPILLMGIEQYLEHIDGHEIGLTFDKNPAQIVGGRIGYLRESELVIADVPEEAMPYIRNWSYPWRNQ